MSLDAILTHFMDLDQQAAASVAAILLERDDLPSGSSFAVTAEAPAGMRRVYLSDTSLAYLKGRWGVQE